MPYPTMCGTRTLVAKTCTACGELKTASEYSKPRLRHGYPSYDSWCRACHQRAAGEINRKANDESLEKATQHRERWSKDELETLRRLRRLGLSTRDIAERLGRTREAVFTKFYHMRAEEERRGVRLFYYDGRDDSVRQVGRAFDLTLKGGTHRLNKAAQELSELHTQLIFFIEVDEGGEYMGIRGLDSLKQGDDREPEDSAEDLEVLTHPSQNEN